MAESVVRSPIVYGLDGDFFSTFKLEAEKVIDEGMCGDIVVAKSLENRDIRRVVKKFSLLKQEDRARSKKLFKAEVQFMQSFDHPFIMKCFIAGSCPEYLAHCTYYYQRGTLDRYVAGEIDLDLAELCVTQTACALRYLHKNNVVHLDVKLDNIFLDPDYNAILGDFGLSKELLPNQKTLTEEQCGGTPCYLAPERTGAADDKILDPYKLDSYCLGVVLWAFALETEPDDGINYYVEARKKRGLSKKIRRWLLKLLDRDPTRRPTVTEFLTRLRREGAYRSVIDNN